MPKKPKPTINHSEPKLEISITASFNQFARLRVPGSRDYYSTLSLPKLVRVLGKESSNTLEEAERIWLYRNEEDVRKRYPITEKELASILRWHLRGLSVDAAVRKVRVDYEITQSRLAASY